MKFPAVFFVALIHMGLTAQDDSTSIFLKDVVIKENRISIPYSEVSRNLEVLRDEAIRSVRPLSINELLQTIGGVDIRQRGVNGVQADLSIRGGTFEQAVVLINGVKMIDPQTGHHMMNLPVDVEDILRVEVLKGPAARTYGVNGFAGAINIVTKVPEDRGAVVNASYGDHNTYTGYTRLSLPFGKWRQSVSYGLNTSDGYRDNTDYTIHQLFYQSEATVGNGALKILGGHASRNFGANGFYGNESFTDQYEEVRTTLASFGYEGQSGRWSLKPRLSWRMNKDNWQFLRQDPEFFQNFHTTHVINGEFHATRATSSGILGLGLEWTDIDIESNNLGSHGRSQFGGHVEYRISLADDRLDVTPGIYLLSISDFGFQLYPGLDVGYRLSDYTKLFLTTGRTSRIPTYTDLYYEDRGNLGNPDLQEETAYTFEIGSKVKTRQLQLQASFFHRSAEDLIDWFRVTPDDKWMPDNFSKATYNGLDFSATYAPAPSGNSGFLQFIRINYLFLNASFESSDFAFSRNVLENLKHQLIVHPSLAFGERVKLNLLIKYNDRVSLEDYLTVDTNLGYSAGKVQLYLKATNLLDAAYRETNLVPMPGRWITVGVRAVL